MYDLIRGSSRFCLNYRMLVLYPYNKGRSLALDAHPEPNHLSEHDECLLGASFAELEGARRSRILGVENPSPWLGLCKCKEMEQVTAPS